MEAVHQHQFRGLKGNNIGFCNITQHCFHHLTMVLPVPIDIVEFCEFYYLTNNTFSKGIALNCRAVKVPKKSVSAIDMV